MDVVRDEDEEAEDYGEEAVVEPRRAPVKLRGRGGFSHPRGRVRGIPAASHASTQTPSSAASTTDPVDELASSMSALQFIPHSVRMARGRGKGRGG